MAGGDLRERIRFERRVDTGGDEYGNPVGDWKIVHECAARAAPQKVSVNSAEQVLAGRLTGTALYTIIIRDCVAARKIDATCRAVDTRNESRVFNVRSTLNLDEHRKYISMDCEIGVGV